MIFWPGHLEESEPESRQRLKRETAVINPDSKPDHRRKMHAQTRSPQRCRRPHVSQKIDEDRAPAEAAPAVRLGAASFSRRSWSLGCASVGRSWGPEGLGPSCPGCALVRWSVEVSRREYGCKCRFVGASCSLADVTVTAEETWAFQRSFPQGPTAQT